MSVWKLQRTQIQSKPRKLFSDTTFEQYSEGVEIIFVTTVDFPRRHGAENAEYRRNARPKFRSLSVYCDTRYLR